jgi:hypothetical protein
MATITLEVPDELAAQFNVAPETLPVLIREAVAKKRQKRPPVASHMSATRPLYQEILDFLVSSPTPQQVMDFKISPSAQARLEQMLHKNREEEATLEERTELETYLQFSHLMTRLKARAICGQPFLG